MSDPHVCQIRSTTDSDGAAACLLDWGPVRALLAPPVVLATARDLAAAAAAAELDVAMVQALQEDLGADDQMLGLLVTMVRSRRPLPTTRAALRIEPIAGARTGQPYVHIGRGSMKGELSPDEAREMANVWTQVAVAAHIDVRLRHALRQWDRPDAGELEELFTLIQQEGP
ncbi:hypothetical protein AB0F46_41280 [Streptomyces sp. NPDC026665]|uniref:hypothetical protein n=1 Tax=Streptomyces sp. NPDC026665 TaxID=3154798 RepID=UPI0033CFD7D1